MRRQILLLLLFTVLPAVAATRTHDFEGTVTYVTDGDTIWVRPVTGGAPMSVRLQGIDAPEACQAFGPQARDALAARVLHRPVHVAAQGRDSYHRVLARVSVGGQDIGAWLVFSGHAWSYHYRRNPGPYAQLESQARQGRRGLWAASGAVEPRAFRKQRGRCH